MNVFLLCAGYGTRLTPITKYIPKPLVPLLNTEMLNYNIFLFNKLGFKDFVVNVHHLKEIFLNFKPIFDVNINYSLEDTILGTAGGIKNAELLFKKDEPIIIMNGDIYYNFDVKKVIDYYKSLNNPLALMVLQEDESGNVTSNNQYISSLREKQSDFYKNEDKKYKFTGLHIISYEMLKYLENEYSCIIEKYIELLNTKRIYSYIDTDKNYWSDIGTPESLLKTNIDLINNENYYSNYDFIKKDNFILSEVNAENSVIGKNVEIDKKVFVKNSVIFDNYKYSNKEDIIYKLFHPFK